MADPRRGRLASAVLVTAVGGLVVAPSGALGRPPATAVTADRPGEWWRSAMGVDELAEAGTGGGKTVAVIDGPIDPDVPELRGKVDSTESLCLDLDGDGLSEKKRSSVVKGPEAEHATSMAAMIVGAGRGTGPGGTGIRGIAPDARIRHYAVIYDDDTKTDGTSCGVTFPREDEVRKAVGQAISKAALDGADVISVSLTSGYSQQTVDGLLTAYRQGAVVVASTGNERGKITWPGVGNGVVLVNPVGENGRLPDFAAGAGRSVGTAAPGEDIMAGVYDSSGWHSERLGSGSSISTAIVSGGIAAMWSAHPDATAGQVLQAVRQAPGLREKTAGSGYETWFRREGEDLPQVRTRNASYGWGIFDPADAVRLDLGTLPRDNPFVRTDNPTDEPAADDIAQAMGLAASASTSGDATASPGPTTARGPEDTAAASSDESGPRALPWVLGTLVLVVLAAGGGLALRSRRHLPETAPPVPSGSAQTRTDPVPTSHGASSAEGRNDDAHP
ncbi:S8 family serine peptidase [Phycicoccus sp. CSK15P-2]|uniref:S8 family peptidase n=1 Tax=Phycicoccus sp. CSK15P-2 TaxID=2807627 RepID=UPI001952714E|nr:S8 family serine peptidase [Phycicoccus sp. CSK15P-2]MBM6404229.1 S8 family serine peptidase [Phycicoccus sp. CSK15P-2]